ncbi:DUF6082 family protein [Streptomyces justiciae]|uniref:DUF6082 family protein n=1 Tax=Streptomyces justiciae TaxID=2780140 RepID=A0ABU3LLJ7_9ACTN|nr:DUF6082 family protein [Streptomyces justiciae]MBE8476298.1 hypothetical protein [Streptomyces justiciae]MDT7840013.1 DUF6082 family protein [Streptomyces justiciae]
MRNRHEKWLWWTAVLSLLSGVALTPTLLELVAPLSGQWERLSAVSQTYGALSTLFSAVALIGVGASLAYQARQARVTNDDTQRSAFRELLLVAVADPELLVCVDPPRPDVPADVARQLIFTHVLVMQWHTEYGLGRINDDGLVATLRVHFRGQRAREHWATRAVDWRDYATAVGEPRGLRFTDLMDAAHAEAAAAGPPVPVASHYAADSGT